MKLRDKWLEYQYYVIIGVLSLFALFFLPMIGSEAGLAWIIPTTAAGWSVYVITKLLAAALNIMIFHCFILQGKTNILDNKKYQEANEILFITTNDDELRPRSPSEWKKATYGKKGLTIFITTLISVIGLTQAALVFDIVSMLSYLFTVIMGIIFGIFQMSETEKYWTEEYYKYAVQVQAEKSMAVDKDETSD